MMRGIPNMTVMCTSDDTQTKWAVEEISKIKGPVYLRLCRFATPIIYQENEKFEIGRMEWNGTGWSGVEKNEEEWNEMGRYGAGWRKG